MVIAFLLFWSVSDAATLQEEDASSADAPEEDAPEEAAPLEIVVEARRDLPHASWQVLDAERISDTPGTHGDPFRLVQALPGVAMTREYAPRAGALSIRGANPGDSRFFLDGVELPYLFHFHQYASVLHTGLLEELAVFPSTFGAEYGDAVGGVVAARSKAPEWERSQGGVSGNLLMGGAWGAAPLSRKSSAGSSGISGSARRSFADLGGKTTDWYTAWPVFWDYLVRTQGALKNGFGVSMTLLGAGDSYGRYLSQPDALDPVEEDQNPPFVLDRAFHGVSMHLDATVGSASVRMALAGVVDEWSGTLPEASSVRNERYTWFRQTWILPTDWGTWAGGVDAKAQSLVRQAAVSRPWLELGEEAPLLARGLPVDETLNRTKGGVWLEPRMYVGAWRLQPGVRVHGDTSVKGFVVDPRVTTRWNIREDLRFKAAAGRYSQSPVLDALSPTTGDSGLGFVQSEQAALGLEGAVAQRWELGAEVWGKQLHDVVVEPIDAAPVAAEGNAWGLELTSRYRIRDLFFSYLSLTVGRATRDGAPFEYDQPYAASMVASWHPVPRWKLGARYRFAAGLPYTPVEEAVYNGNTDTWEPLLGEEMSERLPDYHKLDLRVERLAEWRRVSMSAYLEAWWIPGDGNVVYPAWSYDYQQEVGVSGPALVPLVGGEARF